MIKYEKILFLPLSFWSIQYFLIKPYTSWQYCTDLFYFLQFDPLVFVFNKIISIDLFEWKKKQFMITIYAIEFLKNLKCLISDYYSLNNDLLLNWGIKMSIVQLFWNLSTL